MDIETYRNNAFFIIGAPKCGTTSLAKHLAEHNEISFSDPKEPHFFSDDFPFGPDTIKTIGDYLTLFPSQGNEIRYGEGSVFYLYSSQAIDRIEELTKHRARYIVCLRNPVYASFSLHAQHVAFGWEPETDYLTALTRDPHSADAAVDNPKINKILSYLEPYKYSPFLEQLLAKIDESRVFFSVMERDGGKPQDMYDRLHTFLDVSPRSVDHQVRVNDARRIQSHLAYRLMTSRGVIGTAALARKIFRVDGFGFKRPIRMITDSELQTAFELFSYDVAKTSNLIGFDHRTWSFE